MCDVNSAGRPMCEEGKHDYTESEEKSFKLDYRLFDFSHRIVLYCRRCGDVIVKPLEEPSNAT